MGTSAVEAWGFWEVTAAVWLWSGGALLAVLWLATWRNCWVGLRRPAPMLLLFLAWLGIASLIAAATQAWSNPFVVALHGLLQLLADVLRSGAAIAVVVGLLVLGPALARLIERLADRARTVKVGEVTLALGDERAPLRDLLPLGTSQARLLWKHVPLRGDDLDLGRVQADGAVLAEAPVTPTREYTEFLRSLDDLLRTLPAEPDAQDTWFLEEIAEREREWTGEYGEELRRTAGGMTDRAREAGFRLAGRPAKSVIVRLLMLIAWGDPHAPAALARALDHIRDEEVRGLMERETFTWLVMGLERAGAWAALEALARRAAVLDVRLHDRSMAEALEAWTLFARDGRANALGAWDPPAGASLPGLLWLRLAVAAEAERGAGDQARAIRLALRVLAGSREAERGAGGIARMLARRVLVRPYLALGMEQSLLGLLQAEAAWQDPVLLNAGAIVCARTGRVDEARAWLELARQQAERAGFESLLPTLKANEASLAAAEGAR